MGAYLIYDPFSGKIKQFAVKNEYRRQYLGTALFAKLYQQFQGDIIIINVEATDLVSLKFLNSLGLKTYVNQHEMIYSL